MELVEEISFFLGLVVSALFFIEYKREEREEQREELLRQLPG